MNRRTLCSLSVLLAAGVPGCFEDPVPSTTASETGPEDDDSGDGDSGDGDSGDGDGDSGDGDGDTGDGDGDSGDGDGDSGDGDGDTGTPACGDGVVSPGELCLSEAPTQHPVGAAALRLAVADFDPEIPGVVVVGGADTAALLRGDGQGGLLAAETVELLGPATSVAVGDLDVDGDADFVAGGSPNTVMRNDGAGAWEAPVEIETGFLFDSFRVNVAQIDGNAPLDVLYTEGYNTYWSTGDDFSGWSPDPAASQQFTGGDSWLAVTEFGFDGDGFTDLLVASQWTAEVAVVRGMGNGSFNQTGTADICELGACDIFELHAADLNGDDDPDIVASFDAGISVLFANGNGTFAPYQVHASPGADHVSSGDIDNDGDVDLVVASRDDGDLRLHLNDGSGDFGPPLVFAVPGDATRTTAMTDLDGDGAMELLTAYEYNGGGWVAVFEANP